MNLALCAKPRASRTCCVPALSPCLPCLPFMSTLSKPVKPVSLLFHFPSPPTTPLFLCLPPGHHFILLVPTTASIPLYPSFFVISYSTFLAIVVVVTTFHSFQSIILSLPVILSRIDFALHSLRAHICYFSPSTFAISIRSLSKISENCRLHTTTPVEERKKAQITPRPPTFRTIDSTAIHSIFSLS